MAAGLLAAALASRSSTYYLTDRKQFGRPLATFQALRHRLAEAQVVHQRRLLAGDEGSGRLARGRRMPRWRCPPRPAIGASACVYDFHQFLGAMGMTLEHPLHLWTYRLRLLTAELGGRGANALAAADAIWSA